MAHTMKMIVIAAILASTAALVVVSAPAEDKCKLCRVGCQYLTGDERRTCEASCDKTDCAQKS